MPIETLRPDSTVQNPKLTVVDTTAHGATSDDSDATYLTDFTTDASHERTVLGLADPSPALPAGSLIKACRVRVRGQTTENKVEDAKVRQQLGTAVSPADTHGYQENTWVEFTGAWRNERPGGGEWTHGNVGAARVALAHLGGSGLSRTAEVWFDVDYNERPVASVSAPTGTVDDTTRPTIEWTYSDPEDDPVEAAEFRIYAEPGGGWTGDSPGGGGTLVYDSGEVLMSSAEDHAVAEDLVNGSYRTYMRARQQWSNPSDHWSLWDFEAFTVNVDPPAVPTVSAVPDADTATVTVTVTDPGTGEDPDTVEVRHSDDDGATWQAMRSAVEVAITPSSNVAVDDYEAPLNAERLYRARSKRVVGGLTISSDWSSTDGATITSTARWITDVADPDRLHMTVIAHSHERIYAGLEMVHQPAGMDVSVVESETPRRQDMLGFWVENEAQHEAFKDIATSSRTLLYRTGTETVYVRRIGAWMFGNRGPDQTKVDEVTGQVAEVARPPVTS